MRWIVTTLLFVPGALLAQCLSYGPEIVSVSGQLERHTFPGRPNYESVENGDEAETGFYLKLAHPVCTLGDAQSPDAYPQEGVTSIQLVLDQEGYEELRPLLGMQLNLRGKLFAAHTGHHHAPLLLEGISREKGNAR